MYHSAEHPQLGIGVNLEHPRSLRDAVSAERKIMKIRCDFKEKYRIIAINLFVKGIKPEWEDDKNKKGKIFILEYAVKYDLDVERMQTALNFLLGEHDFSSFKSSGTLNPSKVCTLTRAEVEKLGDRVFIHIEGNRFLYNMVRTIVGTLLEIEGHNLSAEHMKEVLEARDRRKAGQTVSPYGLTLVEVKY